MHSNRKDLSIGRSDNDICKNHTGRVDHATEISRVCPSKLSKKELEDLYFTLLENNIKLKKTVNEQNEKLKILNTKVLRMSASHRTGTGKENDCCNSAKTMIKEQKNCIADLKVANERLTERVRVLNMQLCSMKQFAKTSPFPGGVKARALTSGVISKTSSMSGINTKKEQGVSGSACCQCPPKRATRSVAVETESPRIASSEESGGSEEVRVVYSPGDAAELKSKLSLLRQELEAAHAQHGASAAELQRRLSLLRLELRAAREERRESDCQRLREALRRQNELEAALAVERSRASEMETRLRARERSRRLALALRPAEAPAAAVEEPELERDDCEESGEAAAETSTPKAFPPRESEAGFGVHETKEESPGAELRPPASDDSGYADGSERPPGPLGAAQEPSKQNGELLRRMSALQAQLDALRAEANVQARRGDPTPGSIVPESPRDEGGQAEAREGAERQPGGASEDDARCRSFAGEAPRCALVGPPRGGARESDAISGSAAEGLGGNGLTSDDWPGLPATPRRSSARRRASEPAPAAADELRAAMARLPEDGLDRGRARGRRATGSGAAEAGAPGLGACEGASELGAADTSSGRCLCGQRGLEGLGPQPFQNSDSLVQNVDRFRSDFGRFEAGGRRGRPKVSLQDPRGEGFPSRFSEEMRPGFGRLPQTEERGTEVTRNPFLADGRRLSPSPAPSSDTDRDLSSLSDLPSEREKSAKDDEPLSPGEDRATNTDSTTYDDSCSPRAAARLESLSEGEILRGKAAGPGAPVHMAATLRALGRELRRCQQLLRSSPDRSQVALPSQPP